MYFYHALSTVPSFLPHLLTHPTLTLSFWISLPLSKQPRKLKIKTNKQKINWTGNAKTKQNETKNPQRK